MRESKLRQVYAAKTLAEQEAAYDAWAAGYERELAAMGYRNPAMVAAVFTRFVPADTAPILDAGCGGGVQAEALAAIGYGPITGVDLSEGMLSVARAKGIYAALHRLALGAEIALRGAPFGAILSTGAITPNHAPPESLDGLLRLLRPGGRIVFTLRDDPGQDPAYPAAVARLTAAGAWRPVFESERYAVMPYGEPEVTGRVHVYERA